MTDGRSRKAAFFVIILVMIALVFLLQGKELLFKEAKGSRLQKGQPAPDFVFPGLDGKMVRLSDYRGKVLFLNVWATWCPPCREEMPSMERLYNELKGNNFEIVAISIDASGGKKVAPFVKEHNLSFPVLLDPEGAIKNRYGITGVPESFIINGQGIIEKVVIGPMDWAAPEVVLYFKSLIQK
jgi:peroxiredoxin